MVIAGLRRPNPARGYRAEVVRCRRGRGHQSSLPQTHAVASRGGRDPSQQVVQAQRGSAPRQTVVGSLCPTGADQGPQIRQAGERLQPPIQLHHIHRSLIADGGGIQLHTTAHHVSIIFGNQSLDEAGRLQQHVPAIG